MRHFHLNLIFSFLALGLICCPLLSAKSPCGCREGGNKEGGNKVLPVEERKK